MPYCEDCGAFNDTSKLRCPACGGNMQFEAPPVEAPSGLAQYMPPAAASLRAPGAPRGSLNDEQQQFLQGYSWAPGCGIYYFSRAMIMFWGIQFAIGLLVGFFGALSGPGPNSGTYSEDGGGQPVVNLIAQLFGVLVAVWAGFEARKRRWNILSWESFEQFRDDELLWNRYGIYGWVLTGMIILMAVVFGIFNMLNP